MLVDGLIIAIIGAAGVIIANLLVTVINDIRGYKKISRRIGDTDSKGNLTSQHETIAKSITDGNNEMKDLLKNSTVDVLRQVQGIREKLIQEKAAQENSFKSLDKDQQKIMGHVEGIHLLARDWERMISRNRELEAEVFSLKNQVKEMENKYILLEDKYKFLTQESNDQDLDVER